MTAIELSAMILGYLIALRRLLGAARPILFGLLPDKAQPYVAAVLVVLPSLADALGLVQSNLDLAEALLHAATAFFVAVRGSAKGAAGLLLFIFAGLSASACVSLPGRDGKPTVSPAEVYDAARAACQVYRLSPLKYRTPESDAACDAIEGLCSELTPPLQSAPPAYGNRIVEL